MKSSCGNFNRILTKIPKMERDELDALENKLLKEKITSLEREQRRLKNLLNKQANNIKMMGTNQDKLVKIIDSVFESIDALTAENKLMSTALQKIIKKFSV